MVHIQRNLKKKNNKINKVLLFHSLEACWQCDFISHHGHFCHVLTLGSPVLFT